MNIDFSRIKTKECTLRIDREKFVLTRDMAELVDTILFIVAVHKTANETFICLELRKCGFFINIPNLKTVLQQLAKEKLVTYDKNKPKPGVN